MKINQGLICFGPMPSFEWQLSVNYGFETNYLTVFAFPCLSRFFHSMLNHLPSKNLRFKQIARTVTPGKIACGRVYQNLFPGVLWSGCGLTLVSNHWRQCIINIHLLIWALNVFVGIRSFFTWLCLTPNQETISLAKQRQQSWRKQLRWAISLQFVYIR